MKIQFNFLENSLFQPIGLELSCTGIVIDTKADLRIESDSEIADEMYPLAYYKPDDDSIHVFVEHKSFMIRETEAEKYALFMFLLFHEASHRLLFHIRRGKMKDHMLWNIAADMEIHNTFYVYSKVMESDPAFRSSKVWICTSNYINKFLFDKTDSEKCEGLWEKEYLQNVAEEIYNDIQNSQEQTTTTFKMSSSSGQGAEGSGGEGEDDGSENGNSVTVTVTTYKTKGGKKMTATVVDAGSGDADGDNADDNDAMTRKAIMENNLQKAAQEMLNRTKGSEGSQINSFLKKLFHVKIDWKKILRSSLMTAVEKSDEYSWVKPRLSMFGMPDAPYLPSQSDYDETAYGTLIIARDESGSMTDDECSQAASIIMEAKEHYSKIILIKHDVGISSVKEFDEINDGIKAHLLKRESDGGTSHKEVFKWIADYAKKHRDDERISCCIFITDMESDIEAHQSIVPDAIPRIYLVPYGTDANRHNGVKGKIIQIER